jgi:hypothetical protein
LRSRSGAAAVSLAAFAFAALPVWTTAARSGIPPAWDGTVTRSEARHEKHPGVDDAWFVYVDGRPTHVDADLARSLAVGDTVRKERWERTLHVNASVRGLEWSRDAERMVTVATLAACPAFRVPRLRPDRRSRAAEQAGRTGSPDATSPDATTG